MDLVDVAPFTDKDIKEDKRFGARSPAPILNYQILTIVKDECKS